MLITISYPYNQLWVVGRPYFNYQAYMVENTIVPRKNGKRESMRKVGEKMGEKRKENKNK